MASTKTKSKKTTSTRSTSKSTKRPKNPFAEQARNSIALNDQNKRDELDAIPGRPAVYKKDNVDGWIYEVGDVNKSTGYPDTVSFVPRHNPALMLVVKYDDIDALPEGYKY